MPKRQASTTTQESAPTASQRAVRTINQHLQSEIREVITDAPYADKAFLYEVLKGFRCGDADSTETPEGLKIAAAFEAHVRFSNVEVIPFGMDMVVIPRDEHERLTRLQRKIVIFPTGNAA